VVGEVGVELASIAVAAEGMVVAVAVAVADKLRWEESLL
jgi:hypothetical protein